MPEFSVKDYRGFEQGPIRPPSEAGSLLLRVTRNCPWNRCKFCPVYKGAAFSRRPVAHVMRDIDAVHQALAAIAAGAAGAAIPPLAGGPGSRGAEDPAARQAARHWLRHGGRQVFLQDADSLIIGSVDLLAIFRHLKERFPHLERVTSYARSRTIARLPLEVLAALRQAGLTRLHIGMESGADVVLEQMHKGATRAQHILAGRKVKDAAIELSEYYMPGLGGQEHMERHALESAGVLNEINPDFIRLRTLAIPFETPLYENYASGAFAKCSEIMVARELELFLENLRGISSRVASDHVLNLFPEVEGVLPRDQERMLAIVRRFLALNPEEQCLYQVGRRTGIFSCLKDLEDPLLLAKAHDLCRRYDIGAHNVDQVSEELMRRFI